MTVHVQDKTDPQQSLVVSKKAEARDLYMSNESIPLIEVARRLEVSEHTIYKWAEDGGWREVREEIVAEANRAAEQQIEKYMRQKKVSTVQRLFDLCERLDESSLMNLVDEDGSTIKLSVAKLKALSQTMKNTASVAMRMTGTDGKGGAKTLIVNYHGGPRPLPFHTLDEGNVRENAPLPPTPEVSIYDLEDEA